MYKAAATAVAQAAAQAERAGWVARAVEWAERVARTAAAEPWGLGGRVVVVRVVVARVAVVDTGTRDETRG